MKSIEQNIKKAIIEMLILKFINESDKYGYQITQEFKKRSNGKFSILEGSMYPILYRLTDEKCISSYEKKVGVRQTRIYYHIEELGKERLFQMIEEYQATIKTIDFLLATNDT